MLEKHCEATSAAIYFVELRRQQIFDFSSRFSCITPIQLATLIVPHLQEGRFLPFFRSETLQPKPAGRGKQLSLQEQPRMLKEGNL
jgi:hypothetical protein